MSEIPEALKHGVYCLQCFNTEIGPALDAYDEKMQKAREVSVYFSDQGKETRLYKRTEKPVTVESRPDREETLLRLAFLTVEAGFDTLVDVSLTSKKVKLGTYQTSVWSGIGLPSYSNSSKTSQLKKK